MTKLKYAVAAILLFVGALAQQTYTLGLKFSPGEVIKYKSTIAITETGSAGADTIVRKGSGGHTMNIKVTGVASKSNMSVTFTNAYATAQISGLPGSVAAADRKKLEQAFATALKQSLSTGNRTQTVDARGIAVYKIPAERNKSVTVESGAFMMLVLPPGPVKMNQSWTANVRMPALEKRPPIKLTYKLVGQLTAAGQPAYKVAVSGSDSQSKKEKEVTLKVASTLTGSITITASGRILAGEVIRKTNSSMTHSKFGTRKSTQTTVQRFNRA